MNVHAKFSPPEPEIKAAMHTRDLMSATLSLSELSPDQLKSEIDDIELAHARLGKIIRSIVHAA